MAQIRSSDGSTRPVSIPARCDPEMPMAAATSRCVTSSIVLVSRQSRAKDIRSGVVMGRVKQTGLSCDVLDTL